MLQIKKLQQRNHILFSLNRFKKLGLRHHPLKNPADMAINLSRFHELCEAYEVLSNRTFISLIFSLFENYL